MIEIDASSAEFDALRGYVAELNEELEAALRQANHAIGQKVSGDAKEILASEIYGVPIPLLASANRTFDPSKVRFALRPYVLAAGQEGPAVSRVKFKRGLTKAFKDKHFASSLQKKGGVLFRQWARSGDLLRHESYALSIEGRGSFSVTLVNTMEYAGARNALGAGAEINHAGRKAGVQRDQSKKAAEEQSHTRSVQWQRQAVEQNKDWIRAQYETAVRSVLAR